MLADSFASSNLVFAVDLLVVLDSILLCDLFFFFPPCSFQEVENLRKQAEIIPQLMAECENITAKLQVHLPDPSTPYLVHSGVISNRNHSMSGPIQTARYSRTQPLMVRRSAGLAEAF